MELVSNTSCSRRRYVISYFDTARRSKLFASSVVAKSLSNSQQCEPVCDTMNMIDINTQQNNKTEEIDALESPSGCA
jgi:hypothetical protein